MGNGAAKSTRPHASCPEELQSVVTEEVQRSLQLWLPETALPGQLLDAGSLVRDVARKAAEDLWALATKDPAADGNWSYVLESYLCYRAVLCYRLSHALATTIRGDHENEAVSRSHVYLMKVARQISEWAKNTCGVEIHPLAEIGPRFVVDHGFGTVIGETVTLGSDCYVLQGVILGSTGISANESGKRHPTLGDRVEVGGFARILGPVTVGDDVVVGSHALVCHDVPSGSRVLVVNRCQVTTAGAGSAPYLAAITPAGPTHINVLGTGLDRPHLEVALLDPDLRPFVGADIQIVDREPTRLTCRLRGLPHLGAGVSLQVRDARGSSVVLEVPGAVLKTLRLPPTAFAPAVSVPAGMGLLVSESGVPQEN